jgi:hypothetical protein
MTEADARTTLKKGGYLTGGEDVNPAILATVLKQLAVCSGKIPKPLVDGIRAVAALLQSKHADLIVQETTTKMMSAISPTLERLAEEVGKISAATEELKTKVSTLENANDNPQPQDANGTPPCPATYMAVAQIQVPPQHSQVIARSQGRKRQVLIEEVQALGQNGLQDLNE